VRRRLQDTQPNYAKLVAVFAALTAACASPGHRGPLPPLEEWQASAAEVAEEEPLPPDPEVEDPFPDIPWDFVPRDLLAPAPRQTRDARLATVEGHVASRMRKPAAVDPARVAEAILRAADWAEVDPILVLAMIEVESGFDPSARSSRGARGLMQVRPATLWREAELSGLAGSDPHAPELNVPAGVLYYRRLLDAFGNKYVALIAYNAGPNRVSALLRSGGIPERFREYPRRVIAAEARLRRTLRFAEAPAAVPGRLPAVVVAD